MQSSQKFRCHPASGIPEGMERCFPFYLDVEVSTETINSAFVQHLSENARQQSRYGFTSDFRTTSGYPLFHSRFAEGRIPISDLVTESTFTGCTGRPIRYQGPNRSGLRKRDFDTLLEGGRKIERKILRNKIISKVSFGFKYIYKIRFNLIVLQEVQKEWIQYFACAQNYNPDERTNAKYYRNSRDGVDFSFVTSKAAPMIC